MKRIDFQVCRMCGYATDITKATRRVTFESRALPILWVRILIMTDFFTNFTQMHSWHIRVFYEEWCATTRTTNWISGDLIIISAHYLSGDNGIQPNQRHIDVQYPLQQRPVEQLECSQPREHAARHSDTAQPARCPKSGGQVAVPPVHYKA